MTSGITPFAIQSQENQSDDEKETSVESHFSENALEEQTAVMQSRMAEASRLVLDGFELGSDAEYTRYPEAFGKRQELMWDLVQGVIGGRHEH